MVTNNDFEKDAIRNIQTYLRGLSFYNSEIAPVPIDGIWASETKQAVTVFQKQHGLPVTGTVDRTTWDLLKREYERSAALNSPPVALNLFPRYPSGFVIKEGDTGYLVNTVQYLLEQLERIYYYPDLVSSGVYDGQTSNAVRDFQRRNFILLTGNVDRETWDAMATQYNILLGYEE